MRGAPSNQAMRSLRSRTPRMTDCAVSLRPMPLGGRWKRTLEEPKKAPDKEEPLSADLNESEGDIPLMPLK